MPIITDLFYLPPLEYFVAICGQDEILLDWDEKFQKQTFRNRAQIPLTNKIETLSIPVCGGSSRSVYGDVNIDNSQKWRSVHLRGFQSAYGKAPFFEFYFPYLESIFKENRTNLASLNLELLTVCLKLLQLKIKVKIGFDKNLSLKTPDIRGLIHPKENFTDRSIYIPYPYTQLFGVDFVPNLSIVDLLFCAGPESREILEKSHKND